MKPLKWQDKRSGQYLQVDLCQRFVRIDLGDEAGSAAIVVSRRMLARIAVLFVTAVQRAVFQGKGAS